MKTKVCIMCEEPTPLDGMIKKASSPDGHGSYCIPCNRKRGKEWYGENPEIAQAYRDAHKEETVEYDKTRYEEKHDEIRSAQKSYYAENADKIMAQQRQALKNNPAKGLLKLARQRCKKSGLACTITEKDITVPEFCPILGVRLEFGDMANRNNSPSLDRINPEQGYIPGNVAVVSYRANRIKNEGTASQHRRIADWMDSQKINWGPKVGDTTEVDGIVWTNAGRAGAQTEEAA